MKSLYIVRHAKSDWSSPGQKDEDRGLLDKGITKTMLIIEYLKQKAVMPDLIISSPAVRAESTAKLIAKGIGYPADTISREKVIYKGDSDDILDFIYETPDTVESLMVVGHNPTLTNLANRFLDEVLEWLPTSAVVHVSFDTDNWSEIRKCERKIGFVIFPKMLK